MLHDVIRRSRLRDDTLVALFSSRSPKPGDGIPLPSLDGLPNRACAVILGLVTLTIVIGNFR